jgi:hypothetical protein
MNDQKRPGAQDCRFPGEEFFYFINGQFAERALANSRDYVSLGIRSVHVYGVFIAPA